MCYIRGLYWNSGALVVLVQSAKTVVATYSSQFLLTGILLCSQRIDHESSSIGQENLP
jgi:hypothetical protein